MPEPVVRLSLPELPRPLCWGPTDFDRHRVLQAFGITLRVYDGTGRDVTNRCAFFDDTPGRRQARLFVHDEQGRPFLDLMTMTPAMEVLRTFFVQEGPGL